MKTTTAPGRRKGFLVHQRTDNWWIGPAITLLVFTAFLAYSMWAGLQGNYYWAGFAVNAGDYLCPLYSPPLFIKEGIEGAAPLHHAWIGAWPTWWPSWIPASPALFILAFPALFRFTCYYYRGAYYKAFAGSPPGCAVGSLQVQPGKKKYKGETGLFIFQNLHRFFLYFAIAFVFILGYDAYLGYFQTQYDPITHLETGKTFGFGVGTFLLTLNPIFIGLYTFGCHSLRHLVGGKKDCFSCASDGTKKSSSGKGIYNKVTWLNDHHKLFAWCSLLWVGGTDIYIRLVSSGVITDLNTW